MGTDFAWNETKNAANVRKHGVGFEVATRLFSGSVLEETDKRRDYGERRKLGYGKIDGRLFVCVYTDREISGRPLRWIISLRKANQRERRKFDAETEID